MAKQTIKKKTIGELLNELPEGVRELALHNTPDDRKVKFPMDGSNLYDALISAFEWGQSKEGFQYWYNFSNTL